MAGSIIKKLSILYTFCALLVAPASDTFATSPPSYALSEAEIQNLAVELAPKVDLFSAVWAIDPEAEFFAGTTRDYVYWIISQFKGLTSREAIGEKIQELRDRPFIKISEMVGPDSDADVMTQKGFSNFSSINLSAFSIRKLDFVSFDRVNPDHPLGKTEIDQGFIPLEKLRLSKMGIMTHHVFGNGLRDIIDGTISIHFGHEETFWNTFYAKSDANHPVLLAVRYLRVVAQDYLHRYGNDFPDRQKLLGLISFSDQQKIKSVVRAAVGDPRFEKFLENDRGRTWLNASLQKSFRSFTNPTAAFELMKEMGVVDLVQAYPDKIESIFSYLLKIPDRKKEANELLQSYGYSQDEIFQNPERYLKNLELYHGAGSEKAFRSLIFQGVLPSEHGSAGRGFYATDSDNIEFAKSWSKSKSGSDTNVVALKIKPTTRLIDISKGSGQKLFAAWKLKNLNRTIDDFVFDFQADLIAYPYSASNLKSPFAFVLKNADAVESRRGVLKFPKPIRDLITLARRVTTETIFEFILNLEATPMTDSEMIRLLALVPEKSITHLLENHIIAGIFKALPNSAIPLIKSIIVSLQNRPHSTALKTPAIRALLNQLFNPDFHKDIVEVLIDFGSSWMESVSPRELALIRIRHHFNPVSARMTYLMSQISTFLKDHQKNISHEHYISAVEFLQDPLLTMKKTNDTNSNDFLSEFYRRSKRLFSDIGIDYIGDINSEIAPFLTRGHFQIVANLDAKEFSTLSPYYLDLTVKYLTSPNSADTSVTLTSARDTILKKFGPFLVKDPTFKNFMLQLTDEITGNLDFLYTLLLPLTENPIDLEFLKPKILQGLSNSWSTIPEAILIELLKIAERIKIPLAEIFKKDFIHLLKTTNEPSLLSLLIRILRNSPQFNEIDFQMALVQSAQHVSHEDMRKIFNTKLAPKFNQNETEELRKSILSNIFNLSDVALNELISFYHQYFNRSLEEDTRHLRSLVRLKILDYELKRHEWWYSKFTKDLLEEVFSYFSLKSGLEFDRAKSILAKVKSPSFDFIKRISEFAQKQVPPNQSDLIPLIVHLTYKASPPLASHVLQDLLNPFINHDFQSIREKVWDEIVNDFERVLTSLVLVLLFLERDPSGDPKYEFRNASAQGDFLKSLNSTPINKPIPQTLSSIIFRHLSSPDWYARHYAMIFLLKHKFEPTVRDQIWLKRKFTHLLNTEDWRHDNNQLIRLIDIAFASSRLFGSADELMPQLSKLMIDNQVSMSSFHHLMAASAISRENSVISEVSLDGLKANFLKEIESGISAETLDLISYGPPPDDEVIEKLSQSLPLGIAKSPLGSQKAQIAFLRILLNDLNKKSKGLSKLTPYIAQALQSLAHVFQSKSNPFDDKILTNDLLDYFLTELNDYRDLVDTPELKLIFEIAQAAKLKGLSIIQDRAYTLLTQNEISDRHLRNAFEEALVTGNESMQQNFAFSHASRFGIRNPEVKQKLAEMIGPSEHSLQFALLLIKSYPSQNDLWNMIAVLGRTDLLDDGRANFENYFVEKLQWRDEMASKILGLLKHPEKVVQESARYILAHIPWSSEEIVSELRADIYQYHTFWTRLALINSKSPSERDKELSYILFFVSDPGMRKAAADAFSRIDLTNKDVQSLVSKLDNYGWSDELVDMLRKNEKTKSLALSLDAKRMLDLSPYNNVSLENDIKTPKAAPQSALTREKIADRYWQGRSEYFGGLFKLRHRYLESEKPPTISCREILAEWTKTQSQ